MLPIVTPEELVQPFSFYFNQEIHQGMTYHGKLNFLVKTFNENSREQAYETAMQLARQNVASIITVSSSVRPGCYRVWVDLSDARTVMKFDATVDEELAA